MKIPSAADIFGNRRAPVQPETALPGPDYVSAGMQQFGSSLAQAGLQNMEQQTEDIEYAARQRKAEQERIEREAKQKAEQAEERKQQAKLQNTILTYKSVMAEVADNVWNDKEIKPEEKLLTLNERAEKIKGLYAEDFGDKAYELEFHHTEALLKAKKRIYDAQEVKATDSARAATMAAISDLERNAARSPKDRVETLRIFKELDWTGFSEQEKEKITEQFRERTASTEIENRVGMNDLTGLSRDLKLKNKAGDPLYLPDMDPKQRAQYIESIDNRIEQEKRRKEAEARAAQAQWRQDVREALSDYKEAKLSGLPINPKDEVRLAKMVKGTEFEAKFTAYKQQGESLAFITEKLSKDPLTFGSARLGIAITPLNLADPQGLPQQLTDRMKIAKHVQATNNLPYAPLLTTDEAKGLNAIIAKQGAGSVLMMEQFTKMLGKEAMTGIAQQLAALDTDDAPAARMTALIAQGKTEQAKAIMEGNRYIKDKSLKMPKQQDLQESFNDQLGKALDGLPMVRSDYYKNFQSVYAQIAAQKGVTAGDAIDKQIAKEAFSRIVGTVARYNRQDVILPEGYDESKFLNFMRTGLTEAYIAEQGGMAGFDNKAAARFIRDEALLRFTGAPNTYRVRHIKDGIGYAMTTKDGRPFEIVLPDPKTVNPNYWDRFKGVWRELD